MGSARRRGPQQYKGVEYKSKFELETAKYLQKNKVTFVYEQFKFTYLIPAKKHKYLTDFAITTKSGNIIFIETKGYFTKPDRDKSLFVREMNPDIDLRFVFQSNNKINRRSPTRYGDWCDKYGFKWATKNVPEEWWNE